MSKTRTRLDVLDEYVVVDVETTGLDTEWCELIEVAAIKVNGGKEVDSFSTLIKPYDLPLDSYITELTGITSEELENAPEPDDVIPRLVDFIGDLPIVGHNVCFDMNFISKYASKIISKNLSNTMVDTLRISRHVYRDMEKRKLAMLVDRCKSDSAATFECVGQSHRALFDARSTQYCYETMKPLLISLYGEDPENGYSKLLRCKSEIDYDGIVPTVDEIDESNPFFGATICFTGALEKMVRSKALQEAVNLGAIPQKGVNKKLDYLVVGSTDYCAGLHGEPSAKLKKAREYETKGTGINIVSEGFFMQYVQ